MFNDPADYEVPDGSAVEMGNDHEEAEYEVDQDAQDDYDRGFAEDEADEFEFVDNVST